MDMLQVLWEQWIQSAGQWDKSELVVQARSTIKGTKTGARRWMLKSDIVQKYGDESIAEELIRAKESDPKLRQTQVRDHPELPHRVDLRLYLCWDSSHESDTEDVVIEQMLNCVQKDSHGRGRGKDKKSRKDKKKRKQTTSSSTSSRSKSTKSMSSKSSKTSSSASSKATKATKATKVSKKSKKAKKDKKISKKTNRKSPSPEGRKLTQAQIEKAEKERVKAEEKAEKERKKADEKADKKKQKDEETQKKKAEREAKQKIEKEKQKVRASGKKAWGVQGTEYHGHSFLVCYYMIHTRTNARTSHVFPQISPFEFNSSLDLSACFPELRDDATICKDQNIMRV